jgi:aminopeptidase
MELIYREVLKTGAHPQPMIRADYTDKFDHILYTNASDSQLARIDPMYDLIARKYQCDIRILADVNTRGLTNIDPSRMAIRQKAQSELKQLFLDRAAKKDLRWVISVYPTTGYAQDADMSIQEYEDFLFSSSFANLPDPVSAWAKMSARQSNLVDWLNGKSSVHVIGNHVDMEFSILNRSFLYSDGHRNVPDGEIFTSPVESSVNGWFKTSFPAIFGLDVGRVSIRFKEGAVVEAESDKNQEFLMSRLDMDEGARRLGEFGIGTNYEIKTFTKNMLFDEKIGGTVHFALGSGFPEAGSQNHSALHWDLLVDMRDGGQIIVDDEVFYDSGEFQI